MVIGTVWYKTLAVKNLQIAANKHFGGHGLAALQCKIARIKIVGG